MLKEVCSALPAQMSCRALDKGHRHIGGSGAYGIRRSASCRQGGCSGDKPTDGESPLPSFLFFSFF
jgi:hypothetical protein